MINDIVRHVGTTTTQHARHSTTQHNTSRHVMTRTTRLARRAVTCHDVTQQVEFGLNFINIDQRPNLRHFDVRR